MKYYIGINQQGIAKAGMAFPVTDMDDWAILDYIQQWEKTSKSKKRKVDDEVYVWFNYTSLINNMPMLSVRTRQGVSKRVEKLRKLKLVKTVKMPENSIYIVTTPLVTDIKEFDSRTVNENEDCQPEETGCQPQLSGCQPQLSGCQPEETAQYNNKLIDKSKELVNRPEVNSGNTCTNSGTKSQTCTTDFTKSTKLKKVKKGLDKDASNMLHSKSIKEVKVAINEKAMKKAKGKAVTPNSLNSYLNMAYLGMDIPEGICESLDSIVRNSMAKMLKSLRSEYDMTEAEIWGFVDYCLENWGHICEHDKFNNSLTRAKPKHSVPNFWDIFNLYKTILVIREDKGSKAKTKTEKKRMVL